MNLLSKRNIKNINNNYDVLIIGAGPVGCVIAERFSKIFNYKCLIIEKRNHIAGNCFDTTNKKKLLYHKYGPHYLRFKNKKTFDYLSNFTKWNDANYIVKSYVNKNLLPFPINLNTLEKFFNIKFKDLKSAKRFMRNKKIKYKKINNSEKYILSNLGKEIYEKFYKNYTIKQWGKHPSKISHKIAGRIPIRYNRNNEYVNEKLKKMPKQGYTKMFEAMLNNKNINVLLNTDFFQIKNKIKYPKYTIYTGLPDRYFNYRYGKLKWRSLKFKFNTYKKNLLQSCVQYNYPNNYKFTRKVEIKHVTKQRSPFTVISKEYPNSIGEPYYPINDRENIKLYGKYKNLISKLAKRNIFFEGRLATYRYLNTDEVIEQALKLFNKIKKKIK